MLGSWDGQETKTGPTRDLVLTQTQLIEKKSMKMILNDILGIIRYQSIHIDCYLAWLLSDMVPLEADECQ